MKKIFILLAVFLSGCFKLTDHSPMRMDIGNNMSMPKSFIFKNEHSGVDLIKYNNKIVRIEDNNGVPLIMFGVKF
jgi:hypothetical protein